MLFILLYVIYEKEHDSKYITTDILQRESSLKVSSLKPIQIYLFVALPAIHQHFLKYHSTVITSTTPGSKQEMKIRQFRERQRYISSQASL